jgi:hypothetical protein
MADGVTQMDGQGKGNQKENTEQAEIMEQMEISVGFFYLFPDVVAHFQNRDRKPGQSQDAKKWRAAKSRSTRVWSSFFSPPFFRLPGFVFRVPCFYNVS